MSSQSRVSGDAVLVTGASTGIGAATARRLAEYGFSVLAGVRRTEDADALRAAGIEPVIADVTEPEGVEALADAVSGRRLRALVNNAGVAINAPFEVLTLDDWRRQLEVNFFGAVAVTGALLPALLDHGDGRVVNVSSIGGRVANVTFGAYSASKFALEAASDALRRETRHLGLHVSLIQPGAVKTEIWEKGLDTSAKLVATMTPAQRSRYERIAVGAEIQARQWAQAGIAPEQVASVILEAVTARRPRARYPVGRDAKIATRMARIIPDRVFDRLLVGTLPTATPTGTGV